VSSERGELESMFRFQIVITAFICFWLNPSWAETVISCGEIKGYAYYLGDPDFVPDQARDSSFTLTRDGDAYDVIFYDVTKRPRSSRSEGAKVLQVDRTETSVTIFVGYPGYHNTALWTFDLDKKKMVYSQHRLGCISPKIAILKAECF